MRRVRGFLIFCLALLPALVVPLALAQTTGPFNEREVKARANLDDKGTVWALDFRFKDPRLLVVDVPGRGKRVVWYLWYQVINNTKEPRFFIPDFELVTLDKRSVHPDQVLPRAEEAIKRLEDPTGYLDIKNSVTITRQPIPVTKPDSVPRAVTGVAIWDDVFGEAPDTTRFSIFVSGLSNGWAVDDKQVVRRKTLQLNFKRLSDRFHLDTEVRFLPPAEWLYRGTSLKMDDAKPAEAMPAEKAKEPEKP